MTYKEKIAEAQAKMDELKAKMAAASDKTKAARALKKEEIATAIELISNEVAETAEGDVNAAKENIRLAKGRKSSKLYALKLKAQMKSESIKKKIAERRAEKDQAAMEMYFLRLLSYAECCQEQAYAAAVEANLVLLEAAEVAAEYIERYGNAEISEEAVAEASADTDAAE